MAAKVFFPRVSAVPKILKHTTKDDTESPLKRVKLSDVMKRNVTDSKESGQITLNNIIASLQIIRDREAKYKVRRHAISSKTHS